MFPALFSKAYRTCVLSLRRRILFFRISSSFIIEPNLDGLFVCLFVSLSRSSFTLLANLTKKINNFVVDSCQRTYLFHFLDRLVAVQLFLLLNEELYLSREGEISFTGISVIKKNTSVKQLIERITNEKMV